MPKNAKIYYCEICDFTSNKQSNYEKHILTKKHKMAEYNQIQPKKCQKTPEEYSCECGKVYSHRASLYNHKKKCTYIEPGVEIDEDKEPINKNMKRDTPDMVTTILTHHQELMKENKEFKELLVNQQKENQKLQGQLIEAVKDGNGKTINNINNNVNYNINVFLNDQCKDAMNLMDFIETIKCKLENLEDVGKLGYVDGISKLFIENLSDMEVTKRPIHCTDFKRKSLYIKNNDEWTKEDSTGTKMERAIRQMAGKGVKKLPDWQKTNPDYNVLTSNTHTKYMGICNNLMGGADDAEDERNFKKITKKIANEVILDKTAASATILNDDNISVLENNYENILIDGESKN
jgi:hypothetical protein